MRFAVTGLDCGSCVARVEAAARSVPGVSAARASLVRGELELEGRFDPAAVLAAVAATGHDIAPLGAPGPAPGYARVLGLVVALNLGYALVETLAGIWGGSMALLADALDFWGDGLISALALVALGWAAQARARVALVQGLFLAAMGLAVLGAALMRLAGGGVPDEAVMGWAGAGALLVNLAAAAVMMRHRGGDASARAVWLFSRNDALNNLAVLAAAGLVALTGQGWPDVVTAAGIAAVFLGSARIILRDAMAELRA